jgi:hypothetical protein
VHIGGVAIAEAVRRDTIPAFSSTLAADPRDQLPPAHDPRLTFLLRHFLEAVARVAHANLGPGSKTTLADAVEAACVAIGTADVLMRGAAGAAEIAVGGSGGGGSSGDAENDTGDSDTQVAHDDENGSDSDRSLLAPAVLCGASTAFSAVYASRAVQAALAPYR